VDASERLVYYGVSALLIVAIGMIFVSTVLNILQVLEVGVLQTTLTILGRTLLILIFIELLNTMGIVAREQRIVAEPFLLIGSVALVRHILSTSAEAEQVIGTERFQGLTTQLEVIQPSWLLLRLRYMLPDVPTTTSEVPKVPDFTAPVEELGRVAYPRPGKLLTFSLLSSLGKLGV
jgi:uncharacterized membrane protein (DUF373 family)